MELTAALLTVSAILWLIFRRRRNLRREDHLFDVKTGSSSNITKPIPLMRVMIKYRDGEGNITSRDISVKEVYGEIIQAYCELRKEMRTFKASQIISVFDPVTGNEIDKDTWFYTINYITNSENPGRSSKRSLESALSSHQYAISDGRSVIVSTADSKGRNTSYKVLVARIWKDGSKGLQFSGEAEKLAKPQERRWSGYRIFTASSSILFDCETGEEISDTTSWLLSPYT